MRRTTVRPTGKRHTVAASLFCVGSALAVSGCTSTLSTLDTGLFGTYEPPQPVPALSSGTNASVTTAPRPSASLTNQQAVTQPQSQQLAAFTPPPANATTFAPPPANGTTFVPPAANGPAPATAASTPPQPVAPEQVNQVQPSVAAAEAPIVAETSTIAETRIAQANGEAPVANANVVTVAQQPPVVASVATGTPTVQSPNRLGLFNRFFNRDRNAPQPPAAVPIAAPAPAPEPVPAPVLEAQPTNAPNTSIALAREPAPAPEPPPPTVITASANSTPLPGVDKERLLGFGQADEPQPETRPIQVASAAGLARLAPNGLRVQHSGVDVACLKPALVRVLKRVERKFGKPVVVTSGYRSPSRNSNARGAKNSLHIYCAAADIQIEGVSKWELASYLRSMPGRGGVGTYCHTRSVHIDIGPKRDWNWRCRRG